MPWTADDVDKHKKGLSAKQKQQWAKVANSVLENCLNQGGKQETCEAAAVRQANGVVGDTMQSNLLHLNSYIIRPETLEGKKYLVVPVVMMVEGVHTGTHGPLLHLSEELGKIPDSWNGIPVTISHPQTQEGYVSANSPAMVEQWTVGRVFNTCFENDKLKAEAWIDEVKIRSLAPEALEYIQRARPLEVSVGVFSDNDNIKGEWKGEKYEAIARNYRPDHLALLPNEEGACNWADGCGVRVNRKGGRDVDGLKALKYEGTETRPWRSPTLSSFDVKDKEGNWAALSVLDKEEVASHFLIGNAGVATFEDLHFPVVNPKTGKLNENALRAVIGVRGAQLGGVATDIKANARRKAYQLLNKEFEAELEIPENLSALMETRKALMEEGWVIIRLNVKHGDKSFEQTISAIHRKLNMMDDDHKSFMLQEVFEDYFVYEVMSRDMDAPVAVGSGSDHLFKRGYKVESDGVLNFIGDPIPVERKVEFVEKKMSNMKKGVNNMAGETVCCLEELKKQGIGAAASGKEDPSKKREEASPAVVQVNREQALEALKTDIADPIKAKEILTGNAKEQLLYGMKAFGERKDALVKKILANSDAFTKEELESKSLAELEKLGGLVKKEAVEDYSGQGAGGPMIQANQGENVSDMLTPVLPRKKS